MIEGNAGPGQPELQNAEVERKATIDVNVKITYALWNVETTFGRRAEIGAGLGTV
jgi:hypothetical protein